MLSTLKIKMDFQKINFGYSTKNIPIPSEKNYLKCLINKTDTFLRNIRWRTLFFLNPETKTEVKENFGFKSTKTPPQIPELKEFEEGMLDIVQNIEFKKTTSNFQKQLNSDICKIKESDNLYVAADKTTNFYKIDQNQYNVLLERSIQKDYKKSKESIINITTKGDKDIGTKLQISDRIDTTAKSEPFITLKDHKPNFNNNPSCRLINPCKSEIGKISKKLLETINSNVIKKTNLNQWKNTDEVLSWYKKTDGKQKSSFICFDICDFYPSITEELLINALEFASKYAVISDEDKHTILHSKRAMLFNKGEPWAKRGDSNFDVTMGSFDGAETCELVGLYILSQLKTLDINVGLYRDDGLAISKKTPRQTENIKKEICAIFSKNNLKITIEANKKSVDFLDITLDLTTGMYKPYMKPNNTPLYVHKDSNHPPSIIKNIPININKRLSNISSSEQIFKDTIPPYQEALQKSGYNYKLKYDPQDSTEKHNKKRRNRNITWFNPPFSESVATNIGKKFFNLLNKCFPKGHKLNKLLNKNTVKLSYSCVTNVKSIINIHNSKTARKNEPEKNDNNCNCQKKAQCPLQNNCLTKSLVYQASVTQLDNMKIETYIGLTENSFKTRFAGHMCSFKHKEKRSATSLSEHIWDLKDNNKKFTIKWKIISKAKPYSPSRKKCNLCVEEKYYIIHRPEMSSLNKRNELINTCLHRKKYLLCNQ